MPPTSSATTSRARSTPRTGAGSQDGIVVIKGCGSKVVPANAYLIATQKLQGVAGKLMYGEPCSSVPLWRKPKAATAPVGAAKPVGVRPVGLPTRK